MQTLAPLSLLSMINCVGVCLTDVYALNFDQDYLGGVTINIKNVIPTVESFF